jgi:hypothetical protein
MTFVNSVMEATYGRRDESRETRYEYEGTKVLLVTFARPDFLAGDRLGRLTKIGGVDNSPSKKHVALVDAPVTPGRLANRAELSSDQRQSNIWVGMQPPPG